MSNSNLKNHHTGNSDNSNSVDSYILQRVNDSGTMNSTNISSGRDGDDSNKLVFSETTEFSSRIRLQQMEKDLQRGLINQMKQKSGQTTTSTNEDKCDSLMDVANEDVSCTSSLEDVGPTKEKNVTPILKGPQA